MGRSCIAAAGRFKDEDSSLIFFRVIAERERRDNRVPREEKKEETEVDERLRPNFWRTEGQKTAARDLCQHAKRQLMDVFEDFFCKQGTKQKGKVRDVELLHLYKGIDTDAANQILGWAKVKPEHDRLIAALVKDKKGVRLKRESFRQADTSDTGIT